HRQHQFTGCIQVAPEQALAGFAQVLQRFVATAVSAPQVLGDMHQGVMGADARVYGEQVWVASIAAVEGALGCVGLNCNDPFPRRRPKLYAGWKTGGQASRLAKRLHAHNCHYGSPLSHPGFHTRSLNRQRPGDRQETG
ncbi:hypothetical protein N5J66_12465, partial [Pseudomonas juntendi]|uniref:hypothetical protein n=1 Tax=Pseudomonas juntendi TaxID=2666183 RepID=UPI00244CC4DC